MPENLLLLNRYDFWNENFRGYFSHQNATFDTNFKFEWTLPLKGSYQKMNFWYVITGFMLILKHIFIFFWRHSNPLKLTKMSKNLGLLGTLSASPAPKLGFHLASPAPELSFHLSSPAPELGFHLASPTPNATTTTTNTTKWSWA